MTIWTSDELNKIGNAEELEIASRRDDGSLRKSTTIWVIRHGDDLYVRSVNGRTSAWFRGTQVCHEGRIEAGGVNKDVTFEDVATDSALSGQIDDAYRSKYRRYAKSIIDSTPESQRPFRDTQTQAGLAFKIAVDKKVQAGGEITIWLGLFMSQMGCDIDDP